MTTQLGRFVWNFRWSPDSRLVAFDEGLTVNMGWGVNEDWGGLVLDTTQKVTLGGTSGVDQPAWGSRTRGPRRYISSCRERRGLVAWVDTPRSAVGAPQYREQSLITETDGAPRSQPLPDEAAWGGGRFSPDGQTLLVEPAGLGDRVLAVDPVGNESADQLLLTGDLPSEQVRIRLLGWVGAEQVLAAVHESTEAGTWEADADLALLTLDVDAGTADLAVVGRVDAGDTGSAFSFATDLLAADIPAHESREPTADAPDPARDSESSPTLDSTSVSDHPWLVMGAVGLALCAALAVTIVRRKRVPDVPAGRRA